MDLVLPADQLDVGAEIARGAFGVVHNAVLFHEHVCAKVRRASCL
jgi:hypothetical protein